MCYCITDDWLMWPAVVVIIIISHLITLLMLVPCLSKHELHIQHLSKNKWDVKQDKRGIIHSKIGFKAHLKRTCPFSCVPVAAGLLKPRREAAADVTASPARTHARTHVRPECDAKSRAAEHRPSFSVRSRTQRARSTPDKPPQVWAKFECGRPEVPDPRQTTRERCLCRGPQSFAADTRVRIDARTVALMETVPSEETQFVPKEVRLSLS